MAFIFPKQANFIKFMLTNQCARPWFVYAETFVPAFLELLITVVFLDLNDLIRSHGQKISAKGSKKTGRGGRHTPKLRVKSDAGNVERYAAKGLKTLLIVTQPLENIGYAWLMYSAVDQFFYNWQSLIEARPFCINPSGWGPLHRGTGPHFNSILPGGSIIPMTTVHQNRSSWVTDSSSAEVPSGHISFLYVTTVVGPSGGITGVTIRLKVTEGFVSRFLTSDSIDLAAGEAVDIVFQGEFVVFFLGGATVQWQIVGPAVPIGIFLEKSRVILYQVA